MRQARHHTQHAAEAMEKRHGQRHAIRRAEALALADVEAVVQNVAVRQHDAFREPVVPEVYCIMTTSLLSNCSRARSSESSG